MEINFNTTVIKIIQNTIIKNMIRLYSNWMADLPITVNRTGDILEINKEDAKEIILAAEKSGLIRSISDGKWKVAEYKDIGNLKQQLEDIMK